MDFNRPRSHVVLAVAGALTLVLALFLQARDVLPPVITVGLIVIGIGGLIWHTTALVIMRKNRR